MNYKSGARNAGMNNKQHFGYEYRRNIGYEHRKNLQKYLEVHIWVEFH